MKRYRIFVNAIDPAGMDTGLSDEILAVEDASDEFAGTQTNRNPGIRLRPPEAIVPQLSQGASRVIMKLLAKKPDARYQTAEELIEALGRLKPEAGNPT